MGCLTTSSESCSLRRFLQGILLAEAWLFAVRLLTLLIVHQCSSKMELKACMMADYRVREAVCLAKHKSCSLCFLNKMGSWKASIYVYFVCSTTGELDCS